MDETIKKLNENEDIAGLLDSLEEKATASSFLTDFTINWNELRVFFGVADPYGTGEDIFLIIDITIDNIDEQSLDDDAAEHLGDFVTIKLEQSITDLSDEAAKLLGDLDEVNAIVRVEDTYYG